jgi:uncharacterized protein (DUF1015 family)
MRLFAFTGLHYTADAQAAGALCAPPYDQLDDAARDAYHARSPHQFVHLTKPVAAEGKDLYQQAGALHREWLREGVIARDPRPALYPYVIELAGGGRRLGVCALAGLAGPTVIRPHEQTLDKPLADRLALLRETRIDLEPSLFLSEDGGKLDQLLEEDLVGASPRVDYTDSDGHHHLVYAIDDPARIALYRELLSGPVAIADGHHRYKVAQKLAAETAAAEGTAGAAKMAVITSLSSPALTIDPIHRALLTPVDLEALSALATGRQTWEGTGGWDFARAVAAAPQPALGIWTQGRPAEIWTLASDKLAVVALHDQLFPALGLGPDAGTDGTVLYRSDPEVLYGMVKEGKAATGFWLPPMQPAAFAAAIAHGDMLPPKSTRFLPKAMSGLVWSDHDAQLL